MFKRLFHLAYQELVLKQKREVAFWVLLAFATTFLAARLLVRFAPGLFLSAGGTHIHHFTYGIIILAVSGFIALVNKGPSPWWLSALYGVGLGLAFDEFGMWLRLTSNYGTDQSEDALAVILAFLVFVVYITDILRFLWRHFRKN